ncbi:hypothetical protein [Dyadobacter frigoris]|uniref:Uncharacterized protein n=1 Tax=Dyadobacter frigoris TaxID=2576211 RepID=A0A4U6D7A4_9BACT|nr:hypothetical protein [Dyadobacter frigoris]TKT93300.1 hypothetical protein FDK13_05460 [Dyadobacter frigoris]
MNNFTIKLIFICSCIIPFSVAAQSINGNKQFERYEVEIDASDLASIVKTLDPSTATPQILSEKISPEALLRSVLNKLISFEADGPEKNRLQTILSTINPYLIPNPEKDKKGLIALHHPISLETFYKKTVDEISTNHFTELKAEQNLMMNSLALAQREYLSNLNLIEKLVAKRQVDSTLKYLALNERLNILMKDLRQGLIEKQKEGIDEVRKVYGSTPRYIEDTTKIEQALVGTITDDKYFLNSKKVAIVLIGNTKKLTSVKITLVNKERNIKGEIIAMGDLIKGVVGGSRGEDIFTSDPFKDGTESVKITFLIPKNDNKIRPPYDIRILANNLKDTVQVFEKVHFRLKVSFGAGKADVSYFGLKNNQLTFNPDSTRKTQIKSSLAALIGWYPWGQDISHIDGKFYQKPLERISLNGGVRISKDPLEALFLGINYDIQKNFGLFVSSSWYSSTITNVVPLNTGSNVVGYLKDSDKRNYNVRIFFGLTMSPSAIGELLGLNKK